MARTRLYRNGVLEKENFPIADISECVNDPGAVVWLDICTLDDDAGLDDVEEEFGLHALAIEDAAHERQRPKLDHYGTHLFLSAYAIAIDAKTIGSRDQRTRDVRHAERIDHGAQGPQVRHR